MKFRWSLAPAQPLLASQLAHQLRLSPLLAQCLLNRSLSDPQTINNFLEPRLKHLSDPFRLPDMALAVDRLLLARERKEPLVIFGDYDVDGVTSTALLLEVLSRLGWTANYYLPNRMDEGYGLSQEAVENCLNKFPATLLLAVDCGSTSIQSIAWLKQRGVDVIVLDHHQVPSVAPASLALVNPHKSFSAPADSAPSTPSLQHSAASSQHSVPFSELCSVGLAFKLAHALVKRGRETGLPGANEFDLRPLLDLVALGTIADLVPLLGENRILVSAGLQRLNETRRPGLIALKQVARSPSPIGVHEVGFQLAPRLNAAGRLETAEESLHLLLARDLTQALPLAQSLDARNRERQQLERTIAEQAITAVRSRFNPQTDFVIVEGQQPWHIGVVGIVASRVLQQFYRPTIIVGGDGSEWRGSGRSIAGFDLAAALRECNHLLVRHGGHAMAAGVSLAPDKLDAFRSHLNEVARQCLQHQELEPPLRIDAEVGLDEISLATLAHLGRLKPMGQGNPAVQFCSRNLVHQRPLQRIGDDKQHVKMWLTDGVTTHEALWWGAGNESLPVGTFDIAFSPQLNEYNGRSTVQLKTLDWRRSQSSPNLALG
jgi:single-stranded-DNA-specific exonuclease